MMKVLGVDNSGLEADSRSKSVGLVKGSAAWRRSTVLRWTGRLSCRKESTVKTKRNSIFTVKHRTKLKTLWQFLK